MALKVKFRDKKSTLWHITFKLQQKKAKFRDKVNIMTLSLNYKKVTIMRYKVNYGIKLNSQIKSSNIMTY